MSIRVTVWNENRVKPTTQKMYEIYPGGLHMALAELFEAEGYAVHTATLDQPEHGLSEAVLEATDVLVYWAHLAHDELSDEVAERICRHVNNGMGYIPLHSAHLAKPFRQLMGTSCTLSWREASDQELLWCVAPGHPIAKGVEPCVELACEEMYGEYFDIPAPEELVYLGWFSGGEVFRSGVCYRRGQGRIFYFQPGHETCATFQRPAIRRILANAVQWACPVARGQDARACRHVAQPPIEKQGN